MIKKMVTILAVVLLSACSPVMSPQVAGQVQKACADLGLVSSTSSEDNTGVNSVTCKPASNK